jgi:hypothetical protein
MLALNAMKLPSNSFIEQPQAFNAQQSIKLQFLSFNNHKPALNAIKYLPIHSFNNQKLSMHSNQLSCNPVHLTTTSLRRMPLITIQFLH